jgi:O-antigen ligase
MSLDVFIDVLFGLSTLEFISLILDPPIHEYQKVLFQNTFSNRIVSFFIDEPVVGAFINGFYFISCGYLLFNYENSNNKKKLFIILIILIISIPVFLTGERSNSIKLLFGFSIFFLFYRNLTIKKKLVGFFTFLILIITIINFSSNLKVRFKSQLLENFQSKEKLISFYDNSIYFKLYRSGFSVFKNYPLFGVGNKNYRTETCHDSEKYSINYLCSTRPHQIYIEFLSEHGLIGSLIIMSVFFYLIFKLLGQIIKSRNYIQIGSFTYLIIVFLPILPGGSFFSDFNLTLFWINFSTLYASNKETNIFTTSNNNRIK